MHIQEKQKNYWFIFDTFKKLIQNTTKEGSADYL